MSALLIARPSPFRPPLLTDARPPDQWMIQCPRARRLYLVNEATLKGNRVTRIFASSRTHSAIAILGGTVASAIMGSVLISVPSAQAAAGGTWDRIAACESGGKWNADTKNSFYGGLQFTHSTWVAFGGTNFAPRADKATKSQQISVGERVLKAQGAKAWPVCSKQAGLSGGKN